MIYSFAGYTYDPALDYGRLKVQLQRVFAHLLDGEWHTTPRLRQLYGSAADSRIRDLRKAWCGRMDVVTERVENGSPGLFHHRLNLDSVNPVWARTILEGNAVNPRQQRSRDRDAVTCVTFPKGRVPREVRVDPTVFGHVMGTLSTLDALGVLDKMGFGYSAERKKLFEVLR